MSYRTFIRVISLNILMIFVLNTNLYASNQIISKHEYKLYKGNILFGKSDYILYKNNKDYTFEIKSKTAGVFKMKKDNRLEVSNFSMVDGIINPISYIFERVKKDKNISIKTFFNSADNYAQTFNQDEKKEHVNIPYSLDRLSVQIDYQNKIRKGVFENTYHVIDKGRLREYLFLLYGDEVLDTIFGKTNTIIIKREIKNNKRSTLTWYAIDYGYIPVKIEQFRKDSRKFTVILNNVIK